MEGKHSVRELLPIPPIHTLPDGHVYVSLEDCLADLMNRGMEFDMLEGRSAGDAPPDVQEFVTRLQETGRAAKIREAVGPGQLGTWIVEWSDDAGEMQGYILRYCPVIVVRRLHNALYKWIIRYSYCKISRTN